ncbi:ABC transporter ATP-binding protein [Thermocladium modestius]|uniref:ABC transporter ATP-binding protein n=1 Tax=Thermocladium modestius TaxID=62609 RepID=A0A830GX52_9CREN|nr:ABC transporter ATP-binding protein [Thermocladium modestius]GGP20018.1 ABC transporter ATP-binding protein [Thermocladium modestius]
MGAVEAREIKKRFAAFERTGLIGRRRIVVNALTGLSFDIRWGEAYGLLGPNGAGKSTAVKILSTLLLPDEGSATVNGFDVVSQPREVRRSIGLVLYPDKGFYARLSGRENLVYFGRLYGLNKSEADSRATELLKLMDLSNAADRPYEEYSLGMRVRLSIARALIHDPPVIYLDEPTIGLDPISSKSVRELLMELKKNGKAILLTSHNLWEVEEVCDEVGIINGGRIIMEGEPSEIKARLGLKYVIEIDVNVGSSLRTLRVETKDPAAELRRLLGEVNGEVKGIKIREPTLEEAFVAAVSNGRN